MDCSYDCWFSIFIFIIGIVLLSANFQIDKHISNCHNSSLKNTNKAVLILSLISILISLSYMVCQYKLHNVRGSLVGNYGPNVYLGVVLLIGITLIVLGSKLVKGSKNDNCNEALKSANTVLGLGILMTIVTSLYFGYLLFPHAKSAYKSAQTSSGRRDESYRGTQLSFPKYSSVCGNNNKRTGFMGTPAPPISMLDAGVGRSSM